MGCDDKALTVRRIVTANPPFALDAAGTIDHLRQRTSPKLSDNVIERVVSATGIERRHLAAAEFHFDRPAGSMFKPMAEDPVGPGMGERTQAFTESSGRLVRRLIGEIPSEELAAVGRLITVCCTQAASPGLEKPVVEAAPRLARADRWHIGFMGCSAGLAALRLAQRTGADDGDALIVSCELSSLHVQYTAELSQLVANALFADGAAAAIVSQQAQPGATRLLDSMCAMLPEAAGQMLWWSGDRGFQLLLSPELPATVGAAIREATAAFLARSGRRLADVRNWVVHPGGPKILESVERGLGLDANALRHSRDVLRRYGNMSSATMFFILREMLAAGVGGLTVAMAFGPGLTIELALFELGAMG